METTNISLSNIVQELIDKGDLKEVTEVEQELLDSLTCNIVERCYDNFQSCKNVVKDCELTAQSIYNLITSPEQNKRTIYQVIYYRPDDVSYIIFCEELDVWLHIKNYSVIAQCDSCDGGTYGNIYCKLYDNVVNLIENEDIEFKSGKMKYIDFLVKSAWKR